MLCRASCSGCLLGGCLASAWDVIDGAESGSGLAFCHGLNRCCELGLHQILKRKNRVERAEHHGQFVDQSLGVSVQKIAALDGQLPDTGVEDQRVVSAVPCTQLPLVGKISED